MFIPLAAMAVWKKVAIGFGIFIFLFAPRSKDETEITIESLKEFTYEDGRGSVIVSNVNPLQGMVVFKNDNTSLLHYALVNIDGEWVGEDDIVYARDEKSKWKMLLFEPGRRKLHRLKVLSSQDGQEGGDFGTHHVEAYIYVKADRKLKILRKLEYDLQISDTYRNAPEGTGMYWILEVHPNAVYEGGW